MMNVAKNLRLERDKEKKLAEQRQEQLTLVCIYQYIVELLPLDLHLLAVWSFFFWKDMC